jgi:hypothetical protein
MKRPVPGRNSNLTAQKQRNPAKNKETRKASEGDFLKPLKTEAGRAHPFPAGRRNLKAAGNKNFPCRHFDPANPV